MSRQQIDYCARHVGEPTGVHWKLCILVRREQVYRVRTELPVDLEEHSTVEHPVRRIPSTAEETVGDVIRARRLPLGSHLQASRCAPMAKLGHHVEHVRNSTSFAI